MLVSIMMDNPTTIGTRTEGRILAILLQQGKNVLLPFGGGARYDLAYDDNGKLTRVQCKTGVLRNGCVVFNTCSLGRNGEQFHYHGDADLFGVFCPELGTAYLIPVEDMPRGKAALRVAAPRRPHSTIKWAEKYLVA